MNPKPVKAVSELTLFLLISMPLPKRLPLDLKPYLPLQPFFVMPSVNLIVAPSGKGMTTFLGNMTLEEIAEDRELLLQLLDTAKRY